MTTSSHGSESAPSAELSAIESARQAAVDSTRRPVWLMAAYAVTLGAAFGSWTLRTPTGWVVGGILFIVGIVGFFVINARLKRRRGTLMKVSGGGAVGLVAMIVVMVLIGQFPAADSWQPWFAVTVGIIFAAMGYSYLRWDDADTAKRLAAGDFDPNDLMP